MPKITRALSSFLVWAVLVVGAGTARADRLSALDPSAEASPAAGAGGKYGGVTPGQNSKNPLPPAPTGSPRLIWTGFQSTPTGSRVFLQTTSPVSYEIQEGRASKSGRSTLTVVLRRCRIHMANNQRRLDTRAFPTPVQSFVTKQKRGDVDLRIALREPATATPGTEAGPDGTQFVFLDFPPGKAEIIESPKRTDAAGEGELSLPADEWGEAAQPKGKAKGRKAGTAAAQTEPGSVESKEYFLPAAAPTQPKGQGTGKPYWGSGLGVDETPPSWHKQEQPWH